MKTSNYPRITAIAILALAAPLANAETKLVSKGRSGFVRVKVIEKAPHYAAPRDAAPERMKTIGLSVGGPKKPNAARHLVGGRNNARIVPSHR